MKIITNDSIPQSNGHYSQCIEHNGILYISGQLPITDKTKEKPESIESQTQLVLDKIELILKSTGSSREKVIQMRIYIQDIELWNSVDAIYSEFFGSHKPVRCIIPTGILHYDCLIEVEAVAYI